MNKDLNKHTGYLHTRRGWIWFFIIPLVISSIFAGSALVMLLWNHIIPALFPTVGTLTYWHALGLLILCRILFGRFNRGYGSMLKPPRQNDIQDWKRKWEQMTEEKKARLEAWKATHHHTQGEQ